MKATRDWFGDALVDVAADHENIVVVNCDLGSATRTLEFKRVFPSRFIECGIAEANAISIAAGLAQEGYAPPGVQLRALPHREVPGDLPVGGVERRGRGAGRHPRRAGHRKGRAHPDGPSRSGPDAPLAQHADRAPRRRAGDPRHAGVRRDPRSSHLPAVVPATAARGARPGLPVPSRASRRRQPRHRGRRRDHGRDGARGARRCRTARPDRAATHSRERLVLAPWTCRPPATCSGSTGTSWSSRTTSSVVA